MTVLPSPQLLLLLLLLPLASAADDIPPLIPYQGWVQVDGVNHDGSAAFKFAIVNGDGSITYWSHDGSSSGGGEPSGSITLDVTDGLFAVLLGDTSIAGMSAIPHGTFDHDDAHLMVWFDDGSNGFSALGGRQRLATSPYAFRAQTARAVDSDSATGGQVLTADGSGGTTWQTPATARQITLVADGVPETALDCSGVTSIKVDTTSSAERIEGLTAGSAGQEVKLFNAGTNSLTLAHNAGSGAQDIFAPAADDVVLGAYGGVTLVCDGNAWYVIERPATYED